MKNKFMLLLLCPALMLVSCGNNNNSSESKDNVESSESASSIVESALVSVEESLLSSEEVSVEDSTAESVEVKEEFKVETDVVDGYTCEVINDETVYTFSKDGEYTLSGHLNGQILFADNLEVSAKLFLNNVEIESSKTCVFWQSDSKKIELSPLSGTTNSILCTGEGNGIESNNNIELSGNGTLNITSTGKHAVNGSNITISGDVELNVTAKKDAFHCKEMSVEGGKTTIENCDDAFQVEVNSKGKKGTFIMNGGSVVVSNCKSAVKADTSITISDGRFDVNDCEAVFVDGTTTPALLITKGTTFVNGQEYNN